MTRINKACYERGCACYDDRVDDDAVEVILAQPEREWVELTDEDKNDCLVEADPCECLATPEAQELMRCVAAKLRSKNT